MRFTLVRGLTREKYHWEKFPEKLKSSFPGAEIEFVDLPGNGEYASLDSPLKSADYLKFVRARSQFVRHQKKTNVIAVSLAAMVVQEWAYQYPEELLTMVLLNTSLRPSSILNRLRPSGLFRLLQIARIKDPLQREKQILFLTTTLPQEMVDEVANRWAERSRNFGTRPLNFLRQLLAASMMSRREQAPLVPCLLLSSSQDALVNPSCSEELAQHWQIGNRVHPAAGHDLTLDDPDWVIQQLKSFYQLEVSES